MDKPSVLQGCRVCGSTDIQITAWVYVNFPNTDTGGDGPMDDVWCPQCEGDVRHMVPVTKINGNVIEDQNSTSGMVYLLHYEDKHDNLVRVYISEEALLEAKNRIMCDPKAIIHPEDIEHDDPNWKLVIKALSEGRIKDAWEPFVKVCIEQEVYLRVEEEPLYNTRTATGRLSASSPNFGNIPKRDNSMAQSFGKCYGEGPSGRLSSELSCNNDVPRTSVEYPKGFPYCVSCRKVLKDCGCDGPQGTYYPDDPEQIKEE